MPCARAAVGPQRTEQEMNVLSRFCFSILFGLSHCVRHQLPEPQQTMSPPLALGALLTHPNPSLKLSANALTIYTTADTCNPLPAGASDQIGGSVIGTW